MTKARESVFQKEARIRSRPNHPNIAIVHDFDTDHGVDYLVMKYVPGVTLGEKLASSNLRQKDAISLGTELADGLSAAGANADRNNSELAGCRNVGRYPALHGTRAVPGRQH
jgi:serine/threonine protein kinase